MAACADVLGVVATLAEGPTTYLPPRWYLDRLLWLLCGSVYFFVRCLFDLALVQRPALAPNLTFGGMAWLAAACSFACWPSRFVRRTAIDLRR